MTGVINYPPIDDTADPILGLNTSSQIKEVIEPEIPKTVFHNFIIAANLMDITEDRLISKHKI